MIRNKKMEHALIHSFNPITAPLNFFALVVGAIVLLAWVFRHIPSIPEPDMRLRMPFGKVPFFDGVVLYGLFTILCILTMKTIGSLL